MTPEQIRELSQPLADIYAQLTDDLMANIAQTLATHGEITDTAKWKIQKLSQLGELNAKNIKAIAKATGICPEMAEEAIKNAAFEAASEIEPALHKAAAMGFLAHAADMAASKRMMNTLATYQKQAVVSFNLVNTVMAYKARDAYTGIVNKAVDLANREEYLQILGKNTASVVTGTQSRTAALRQCIKEFSEKGLPGFVDKSGREWSPEAYINMDIRTTVNNVAHQAQFDRMDDYGCDLIEVSSHIGARPLCEPYQGKLYSRSGKDGYTTDLNGQKLRYTSWAATSYGQPAGLLGINCGHQVYPFIPGYSRMTYKPYDKETNDKVYQESQRQRYLERKVRESKRECAMLDKLGDKEGFDKAAERLKQREQALKQYTQETGRARKRDREQVNGFDRRVSNKSVSAAKRIEKQKQHAIMLSEIKSATGIKGDLEIPPRKIEIKTLSIDTAHITSRRHGVNIDQAKEYIKNAEVSISRWNGKYINYYSVDGATYVNTETNTIRTAFSAEEYDEKTKSLLREVKKYAK